MRMLVAVACGAEFLVVLDASVVTVALPAIGDGLGAGPGVLQWVVTAYALVFGGFLLLGGRIADLAGLRPAFLAGLALVTVASAAGGLATSPTTLVVARAAQGLGAAVLAPAGLTLLTTTVPDGPRRVRALAIWTALASAGGAAGSLLGGLLTDVFGWRATLLVNVPCGLAALAVAVRVLPRERPGRPRGRLDVVGAVTATAGLVVLTVALSGAGQRGWSTPATLGPLAAAIVLLATFVVHEARWASHPLVPPRLVRLRPIAVGNVAMLVAGAALMPMWFFLSLRLQDDLGLSPFAAGLGFLPHTLLTVVTGVWAAPALLRRVPPRALVVAGCLVTAAGFAWQATTGVDDGYVAGVLLPAVPIAVGGGLLNTPLTATVTSGVSTDDAGAASGLMNTVKQAGSALGLAALVTAAAAAGPSGFAVAFALMAALMVAVACLAVAIGRTAAAPTT